MTKKWERTVLDQTNTLRTVPEIHGPKTDIEFIELGMRKRMFGLQYRTWKDFSVTLSTEKTKIVTFTRFDGSKYVKTNNFFEK